MLYVQIRELHIRNLICGAYSFEKYKMLLTLPLSDGHVFSLVCLLVCQQDYRKNFWPDFHDIWRKGVAWVKEEGL